MRERRTWAGMMLTVAVVAVSGGVLVRAASLTSKYDAEVRRLRTEWRTAQQAEGLDPSRGRKALYDKYPTPEITLATPVVVAPGASAPVSVTGRFPTGTAFLVEHDGVTLASPVATASRFTATATVGADALPGFARVFAYTPVSGAWNRAGVVVIGATPTMTLTASNGWTVRLAPAARAWTINGGSATLAYKADYSKPGDAAAFESVTGTLSVSHDDRPDSTLSFSMQPGVSGTALQEYQQLMSKMADPAAFMKMSEKERAAFEKKMEEVGDRMTKEMEAMSANPAAAQEKQAQFGCGTINVTIVGRQVNGNVGCGQKVGYLSLVGTRE
ncbi:MAG TPA: hypothetical protein VMF13_20090 [Luteitalea sp.]|nr:hypothetical protein [Luteitalea sp.]